MLFRWLVTHHSVIVQPSCIDLQSDAELEDALAALPKQETGAAASSQNETFQTCFDSEQLQQRAAM